MTAFFLIPAVALTIQSIWSLRGGFQFLALVRRNQSSPSRAYQPFAAVIIPCKGLDEDLRENAEQFMSQDYDRYQLIFVVASEEEPARVCLSEIISRAKLPDEGQHRQANVIVAGYSQTNGEKVNNLLAGVSAARPEVEVLVFADIDARPREDWLRALVAPLADPAITVSTGFRWYLPSKSIGSRLRAAWDTSIATMMGEHDHNFAWGGSMAIRHVDFERLKIAQLYWQGTVSDDYSITRAVRAAGGSIHFEPRCLMPSGGDCPLKTFFSWTNRQIIITRVYAPHYWRMGLASYGLYAVAFIWGVVLLILPGVAAPWKVVAGIFLAGVLALGAAKGWLRAIIAREVFPWETRLRRYGGCYWRLTAVIPWVMLFNFVTAAFLRRIEWRGTTYDLKSIDNLKVVRREAIAKR